MPATNLRLVWHVVMGVLSALWRVNLVLLIPESIIDSDIYSEGLGFDLSI